MRHKIILAAVGVFCLSFGAAIPQPPTRTESPGANALAPVLRAAAGLSAQVALLTPRSPDGALEAIRSPDWDDPGVLALEAYLQKTVKNYVPADGIPGFAPAGTVKASAESGALLPLFRHAATGITIVVKPVLGEASIQAVQRLRNDRPFHYVPTFYLGNRYYAELWLDTQGFSTDLEGRLREAPLTEGLRAQIARAVHDLARLGYDHRHLHRKNIRLRPEDSSVRIIDSKLLVWDKPDVHALSLAGADRLTLARQRSAVREACARQEGFVLDWADLRYGSYRAWAFNQTHMAGVNLSGADCTSAIFNRVWADEWITDADTNFTRASFDGFPGLLPTQARRLADALASSLLFQTRIRSPFVASLLKERGCTVEQPDPALDLFVVTNPEGLRANAPAQDLVPVGDARWDDPGVAALRRYLQRACPRFSPETEIPGFTLLRPITGEHGLSYLYRHEASGVEIVVKPAPMAENAPAIREVAGLKPADYVPTFPLGEDWYCELNLVPLGFATDLDGYLKTHPNSEALRAKIARALVDFSEGPLRHGHLHRGNFFVRDRGDGQLDVRIIDSKRLRLQPETQGKRLGGRLPGNDMGGAGLRGTDFARDLRPYLSTDRGTLSFSWADLRDARWQGCQLPFAYLDYANLCGADFSGANLHFGRLPGILTDENTNFSGADLTSASGLDARTLGVAILLRTRISGEALAAALGALPGFTVEVSESEGCYLVTNPRGRAFEAGAIPAGVGQIRPPEALPEPAETLSALLAAA